MESFDSPDVVIADRALHFMQVRSRTWPREPLDRAVQAQLHSLAAEGWTEREREAFALAVELIRFGWSGFPETADTLTPIITSVLGIGSPLPAGATVTPAQIFTSPSIY